MKSGKWWQNVLEKNDSKESLRSSRESLGARAALPVENDEEGALGRNGGSLSIKCECDAKCNKNSCTWQSCNKEMSFPQLVPSLPSTHRFPVTPHLVEILVTSNRHSNRQSVFHTPRRRQQQLTFWLVSKWTEFCQRWQYLTKLWCKGAGVIGRIESTLPQRQAGTDWGSLRGRGGIPHAAVNWSQSKGSF